MSEPILTREAIATLADDAARAYAAAPANSTLPANPFPVGSDAAAAWKASFERFLLLHTAPFAEGSA